MTDKEKQLQDRIKDVLRIEKKRDFEQDLKALKLSLRDAGYVYALTALDFAKERHPGLRKDGTTPNFYHQVRIAKRILADQDFIKSAGLDVDEVLAEGILHDTPEEHQHLKLGDIENLFIRKLNITNNNETEIKRIQRIALISMSLSKVRNGTKISTEEYFTGLLDYPEALLVKLYDRRDNVRTMPALLPQKAAAYYRETEDLLEIANQGIVKYPGLKALIDRSIHHLVSYLDMYRDFTQMAADGMLIPYFEALQGAGVHAELAHRPLIDLRTSFSCLIRQAR